VRPPSIDLSHLGKAGTQVVGQVDNKFIACRFFARERTAAPDRIAATRCFIVVIDQHAADERIRLESILNDLTAQVCSGGAASKALIGDGAALRLTPAEQKFFSQVPLAVPLLHRWGLTCVLQADSDSSVPKHALITTVPKLLANRLAFEHPEVERAFHDYVGNLIDRAASDAAIRALLQKFEGDIAEPTNVLSWCPPRFIDLAKSNACRGQSLLVEIFDAMPFPQVPHSLNSLNFQVPSCSMIHSRSLNVKRWSVTWLGPEILSIAPMVDLVCMSCTNFPCSAKLTLSTLTSATLREEKGKRCVVSE
jgi:hypothetical protein